MEAKTKEIMKMKLPEIELKTQSFIEFDGDMVLPVFKTDFNEENGELKAEDLLKLDEKTEGKLKRAIKLNKFCGKEEETLSVILDKSDILLVGCGGKSNYDENEYINESITGYEKPRLLGIKAGQSASKSEKKEINIGIRGFNKSPEKELIYRNLIDGVARGLYNFNYKCKDEKDEKKEEIKLEKTTLLIPDEDKDYAEKGIKTGQVLGKAINFARALIDEPSTILYPATLVEFAQEYLKDSPCDIEVWDFDRIKKEGMGCFEAVAKGNEGDKTEAKFLVIRSKKKSKNGKLALIGKGVTYDTGGYNLKPSGKLFTYMKDDMGGSAAVIAATKAILELDLDIELVTAVAATENTISKSAIKPGDVVKAYNGKSVEIMNTDAEGRLTLADALAYIWDKEKPDYMIDIATLTGSCMVSLGLKIAGLMGINSENNKLFRKSSLESGEFYWELPLPKKYRSNIDGSISDLVNINSDYSRWGGTLIAGLLLKEFIGDCKNWIHLDIAGTAFAYGKTYLGEGALGHSVSSLVRYAEKLVSK
jgi:leucyl aminopeptidase